MRTDTTTLDALDNITRLALQVPALTARAEAAEAEASRLRAQLAGMNAASAMTAADLGAEQREVARLREELADCQRERTRNADAAARAINELAADSGQDAAGG